MTLLSLVPLEQSQAQLYVDIYPSQESTNGTLWIFSGSTTAARPQSQTRGFRTASSGNNWFDQDTARLFDPLFASDPGTGVKSLSAIPAMNSNKDYASLIGRLRTTNSAFASANLNVITNTPTMTAGANSQTISHLYFRDVSPDNFGPRVSSSLSYNQNDAISWTGAGTLANVPISVFSTRDPYIRARKIGPGGSFYGGAIGSTAQVADGLRIRVHTSIIPEPEEYALIFGLFALVFVIVQQRFLQKHTEASG